MESDRPEASELVVSLFERCGPSLFRYVAAATGSPELADDIVQEVFLSLYRDLCLDKRIKNPAAYVFGAARNQIRKHARTQSQRGEVLLAPEALYRMDIPVEDAGHSVVDMNGIRTLFSVLTEREEAVLLLRFQSLKYREIAGRLEISPKTVATLLARAIRKLQKAMKSRPQGERIASKVAALVPKTLQ